MPKGSMDDSIDREDFYDGQDSDADEEEYELLPPDAAVIEGEQRRAREAVEQAGKAIDVNDLYEEANSLEIGDVEEYIKEFRFRYTTRHLLIAMTVLAMLMTMGRIMLGGVGHGTAGGCFYDACLGLWFYYLARA